MVRSGVSFPEVLRRVPDLNSNPLNLESLTSPLTGANAIPLPRKRAVFRRLQPPTIHKQPSFRSPSNGVPTSVSHGDYLGDRTSLHFCNCCLSNGHHRPHYSRSIHCRGCLGWGHTAFNCKVKSLARPRVTAGNSNRRHVTNTSNSRAIAGDVPIGPPSCSLHNAPRYLPMSPP